MSASLFFILLTTAACANVMSASVISLQNRLAQPSPADISEACAQPKKDQFCIGLKILTNGTKGFFSAYGSTLGEQPRNCFKRKSCDVIVYAVSSEHANKILWTFAISSKLFLLEFFKLIPSIQKHIQTQLLRMQDSSWCYCLAIT